MAQFKKAKFYTIGGKGESKQVFLREGYTFEKHGITWGIYKTPDSNPKNLWWIIDMQSGLSVPCGFVTAFASRKEALELFTDDVFAKVEKAFAHSGYAKAVEEFKCLVTAERSGEDVAQADHVRVEVPQPAEEATEEVTEQPACVTSACLWFDHEVEGSAKAGKGKHAGMWWVKNTPENRERFNVAA